jgi:hypothetical protein
VKFNIKTEDINGIQKNGIQYIHLDGIFISTPFYYAQNPFIFVSTPFYYA